LRKTEYLINEEHDNSNMNGFSHLFIFPEHSKVFFSEGIYQQNPLIEKIIDCLCIPPILVVDSRFHSGDFSNDWYNIFENHKVQTNINVENWWYESEKEFDEFILLQ
jgi:hypothetical protein